MKIKYLMVDGSNVARTFFGYNRCMKARDVVVEDNRHSKSILSLMAALHRRLGITEIKVYFDGTVRPQEITPRNLPPSIRIEFGAGTSADDLMFREACNTENKSGGILVVTDDRGLSQRIKGLGRFKVRSVGMLLVLAQMAHINTELYFHAVR